MDVACILQSSTAVYNSFSGTCFTLDTVSRRCCSSNKNNCIIPSQQLHCTFLSCYVSETRLLLILIPRSSFAVLFSRLSKLFTNLINHKIEDPWECYQHSRHLHTQDGSVVFSWHLEFKKNSTNICHDKTIHRILDELNTCTTHLTSGKLDISLWATWVVLNQYVFVGVSHYVFLIRLSFDSIHIEYITMWWILCSLKWWPKKITFGFPCTQIPNEIGMGHE